MSDDSPARRKFLKKATIGGLAVASTAGIAKKVADVTSKVDVKKAYLNDVLPGDKVWKKRKYVTMTEAEKNQMVQMFTENYKKSI